MESNGWKIQTTHSSSDPNDGQAQTCGTETFYGYNRGKEPGLAELSATFKGHGKATLSFGNCYRGQVVVLLNNNEVARAQGSDSNDTITFHYKMGDVLCIKEVFLSVIKLYYLKLECGGNSFRTLATVINRHLLII